MESVLRPLESARRLQFALAGMFDSPNFQSTTSLLVAPNLGIVLVGDANQSPVYLVVSREISIKVRPVPQLNGGSKYAFDQLANPTTITFRPSGSFGELCLISGQLGTTSADPRSLELFKQFSKEIRHRFTKIKSFYIGKEASELLDRGWRLTSNVKSPALFDLSRE